MDPSLFAGRYEILESIGEGGFGRVFLVYDRKRKKKMALKTLVPPADKPDLQEYFLHSFKSEFEILIHLKHPHLCTVYDYGFDKERNEYYFTEEWLDGKNLLEATHNLSYAECEVLFVQTCRAMEYIHSHGIVHFDIKPGNILVVEKNGQHEIKIIDFGLAQFKKERRTLTIGTIRYMAPEMFVTDAPVDHRSDLYALGLVFYEVFSRHYPFNAATQHALVKAHRLESPADIASFNPRIPNYIIPILSRLLFKDPSDRFYHANSVIHAINLTGETEYPLETKDTLGGYAFSSQLIGRENLLQELKTKLLSPDESRFFCIFGEEGLGKSRLIKEMLSFSQLQQIPHLEIGNTQDFWSLLPKQLPEQTSKNEFKEYCAKEILKKVDSIKLFLIDDFQKLEPIQQEIISIVMKKSENSLLFLITLHPNEVSDPFNSDLELFRNRGTLKEWHLSPFKPEQTAEYFRKVFGTEKVPEEDLKNLHALTGGNPLFLEELAKFLIRENSTLDWKKNRAPSFKISKIPSLEKVLDKILKRIHGDALHVLQILALHKTPILRTDWEKVSERQPVLFQKALAELSYHQIVHSTGKNTFEIRSHLLKNLVCQNIPQKKKMELHNKIFEFLSETGASISNLAFHAVHLPSDPQKDSILWNAAMEAEKHFEYEQALYTYEQLIRRKKSPRDIAALNLSIAKLQISLGHLSLAKQTYEKILKKSHTDKQSCAYALRGLGWICQREGHHDAAFSYFQQSLKTLEELGSDYQIMVLNDIGHHHLAKRQWNEAIDSFQKSADLLEKNLNLEYAKNNHLASAYGAVGRTIEAVRFLKKKLQWALEKKDLLLSTLSYTELGQFHLESGQLEEAKQYYLMALEKSRQIYSPQNKIKILNDLLSIAQTESNYGKAIQYLEEILGFTHEIDSEKMLAHYNLMAGNLYSAIGLFHKAQDFLKKAQSFYTPSETTDPRGWVYISFGYLHSGLEQWASAARWFENALQIGKNEEDSSLSGYSYCGLCEIALRQKNKQKAKEFLREIQTHLPSISDPEIHYRAHLFEAELEENPILLKEMMQRETNPEHRFEILDTLTQQMESSEYEAFYKEGNKVLQQLIDGLPEAYQESFKLQPRIQRFLKKFKSQTPSGEKTPISKESYSKTKVVE